MRKLAVLTALFMLVTGAAMADTNWWTYTFTPTPAGCNPALLIGDVCPVEASGTLLGYAAATPGVFIIDNGGIYDTTLQAAGSLYVDPTPGQVNYVWDFQYDNLLYPSGVQGTLLDNYGLVFQVAGVYINIWGNGALVPDTKYFSTNASVPGTFAITAAPEPGAFSMLVTMLAGLGGLAGILKRKRT